jgi:hypothetical protein
MLRLSLLVTSGKYQLIVLEQQIASFVENDKIDIKTKSLRVKLGDMLKPVSIKIQANNVLQNEER